MMSRMGKLGAVVLTLLLHGNAAVSPAKSYVDPGDRVTLDLSLDTPVILEGSGRRAYLRVALKGFEMRTAGRTPVNLAIVIDRSGSMAGAKLAEARRAALMALDRLGPDDIVSVIAYDDTVDVLAPASKLGDGEDLRAAIRRLREGGSTALFAGVSMGGREIRKFVSRERVNRMILLSDGLANVGPSSPGDLAELGATLAREGIAVTTIGLGLDYNEELMSRLASSSDGNHFFAERAEDLARVWETELGEVLSVIAQDVDVTIRFHGAIRPVRVLGREADVRGHTVVGRLNQLYGGQTKYFVVEVDLPPGKRNQEVAIGDVEVAYANMQTRRQDRLEGRVTCRYSDRQADVDAAQNPLVMASVARQLGSEKNRQAMELRDQGKVEAAKALLLDNAAYLEKTAKATKNEYLAKDAEQNKVAAENLDPANWKRQRKVMEKDENEKTRQQGYRE